MTKALAPPVRRRNPVALMSKPELSRLILVTTTGIIATVLAIWLLKGLLGNESGQLGALWVRYGGRSSPFLPFRDLDASAIGRGQPVADTPPSALKERVAEVLRRREGKPVVVYLSAPGIGLGGIDVFLPNDPDEALRLLGASTPAAELPGAVGGVLEAFAADRSSKKLLILDAGQIGTDRDLGVFGNGFLAHLAEVLNEKPWKDRQDLAILCACAPGQVSWTSEADRRTIFGYFVAKGLAGAAREWDRGQLSVQGLTRYVTAQVKRWAADHRQARQTPIVLGNAALDFPLDGLVTAPPAAERTSKQEKAERELEARLKAAWAARDALDVPSGARPYRRTPLAWRRYLDGLLRAERFYRAGLVVEAGEALDDLKTLHDDLVRLAGGYPADASGRLWSLALVERQVVAESRRRAELDAGWKAIDEATARLVGGAAGKANGPGPIESLRPSRPSPAEEIPLANAPRARAGAPAGKGAPAKAEAKGSTRAEAKGAVKAEAKGPVQAEPPAGPDGGGVASGKGEAIDRPGSERQPPPSEPRGLLDDEQATRRGQARYLEGQLLAWAFAYRRLDGAPEFRRDALEAFRVRALAERAAAADERILHWVAPLIERADALRRRAQDRLFVAAKGPEAGVDPLREAADQYDRIIHDYADMTCEPALDLVQKITAELPYYAEWAGRAGEAPEGAFQALLHEVVALSRALDAGPRKDYGKGPRHPAEVAELDELVEEIRALWGHYSQLKNAYDSLHRGFLGRCEQDKGHSGRDKFRAVDALLCVPTIPAATRMQLLARVRSADLSPALAGSEVSPADAALDAPATSDDPNALADPEPEFWAQAQIQGRVELTLLQLGGATAEGLSEASRALDNALAVRKEPDRAFKEYARFSEEVRAARSRLRARVEKLTAGGEVAAMAVERREADRAGRVLPPIFVETFGIEDERAPDRRLARFLRAEQLRWHGRRLVEDFAPTHALQLIHAARLLVETRDVVEDEARAQRVEKARLTIETVPAGEIHVTESTLKLKVRVAADEDVPAGETAVLVGNRDPDKLAIVIEPAHDAGDDAMPSYSSRDRAATALVVVPTESGGTALPCSLRRGHFGTDNLHADVVPALFYRGRVALTRTSPVAVAISPAKEPVTITMRQDPKSIPKGYKDQFQVHPYLGCMHYGTFLNYIVDLTNNTDEVKNIRLVGRFDGEREDSVTLTLKPRESTRKWPLEKVVSGYVRALDKEFDAEKPPEKQKFKLQPHEVPRHKDRTLTINAFENDGSPNPRALSVEREVVFRQLEVEEYATWEAFYNPNDKMVYVIVMHRANDLVEGPLKEVAAVVNGMTMRSNRLIDRGNGWRFWFPVVESQQTEAKWVVDVGYKKRAHSDKIKLREKPDDPAAEKKDKAAEGGGAAP